MMSGIGEARPALLAAGHLWAQQDSLQDGPPSTVVSAAAAIRAEAQSMVREIYDNYLLGKFRLGALFGHLWSPFLLHRAGQSHRGLPHFQRARKFLMMPRIGEAHPALLAAGHLWAQPEVFQGGAPGTVVFRAAASRTTAQSMVRRIHTGDLLGNFRLGALFGHSRSLSLLRRAGCSCHRLSQFY